MESRQEDQTKENKSISSFQNNEEYLPISNISKIMKSVLNDKLKISKEAKTFVEACVTEFICFITSEASEKCKREKRKTINSEDLLTVMNHLGVLLQVQVSYGESRQLSRSKFEKNQKIIEF